MFKGFWKSVFYKNVKRAKELKPGDIIDSGRTRDTVMSVRPAGNQIMVDGKNYSYTLDPEEQVKLFKTSDTTEKIDPNEQESAFDWEKMVEGLEKSIKEVEAWKQRDKNRNTFKNIISKWNTMDDSESPEFPGSDIESNYENSELKLVDPFDSSTGFESMKAKKSIIVKQISKFLKDLDEETTPEEMGENTDLEEQKMVGVDYGGPIPNSKLSRQDLEGGTTTTKSRFAKRSKSVHDLNRGDEVKGYGKIISIQKTNYTDKDGDYGYHIRFDTGKVVDWKEFASVEMEKSQVKKESYSDWEDEVTREIERIAGVTRSDAQGIVGAQDFYMSQSWGKGMSAKETAKLINQKSLGKSQVQKGGERIYSRSGNFVLEEIADHKFVVSENGKALKEFNNEKEATKYFESLVLGKSRTEKIIRHEGDKWILYSHKGKVLGRHPTKEKAEAQERAVEANKTSKSGGYWENVRNTLDTIEQEERANRMARKHIDQYLYKSCIEPLLTTLISEESDDEQKYHALAELTSDPEVAEILESMASDESGHEHQLEEIQSMEDSVTTSDMTTPSETMKAIMKKHLDNFLKDEYNENAHYLTPEVLNSNIEVVDEHTSDK